MPARPSGMTPSQIAWLQPKKRVRDMFRAAFEAPVALLYNHCVFCIFPRVRLEQGGNRYE